MKENKDTYTITLKPAPNLFIWLLPTLFLSLIALFVSFCYASFTDYNSPKFIWAIFFVIIIIVSLDTYEDVIWALTGEEIITIDDKYFTIQRVTGGFKKQYIYELSQISNITTVVNETTSIGIKLYLKGSTKGIPILSYKNPTTLHFEYKGENTRIGIYCAPFSTEDIRKEIIKRQ